MKRVAAAGAVGSVLVAVGGLVVGTRPVLSLAPWSGYVAAYVGVTGLVVSWLALGLAMHRGAVLEPRVGRWLLMLWGLPLGLGSPLFSRDVFSYVAQGRMVELGLNPYRYGPARLGGGPYLDAVGHVWRHSPAPYGPLFLALEGFTVRLAPPVADAALGMRLVALVGVALLAVFLPRLARRHGVPEGMVWWLGLLNPLLLLHLIGGAHNDALMLGLMVAGLALASEGRPTLGLLLCTLGAAVKVPAALGVIYVGADLVCLRPRQAWRAVAVVGATFGALTYAVGFGWGWVFAVGTPGRVHSSLSPSTAIGSLLQAAGMGPGAVTITRAVGIAVAVVVVIALFALRPRRRPFVALAASMLTVVALGPVIQPWYLLWGIVLLAAVGPGSFLPMAVWISTVVPFLVLPDGTAATDIVLFTFLALTSVVTWLSVRGGQPAVEPA